MANPFASFGPAFTGYLPTIIAAVLILVVGWIIAFIVSRVVYNLLSRSTIDDRVAGMLRSEQSANTSGPQVSRWVSMAVFWLIMAFTIVAFLTQLNLALVSTPLNNALTSVMAFIPNLISALVLLFVAFLIATFLRMVITRVVGASSFARRASEQADVSSHNRVSIGQTIGNVVYWLVFLLFLPAILGALNLNGILAPVQTMVNEVLAMLPNIFAAAVILIVGYFAARIVRTIVVGLLDSLGVNRIGQRAGVPQTGNTPSLATLIGTVVFVLIMIPVAIAALNALNIPAVSQPAAAMLTTFLNAIPAIFGAIVLIAIAYFVARLLGNFVTSLLAGVGFDRLFGAIGLQNVMPASMKSQAIPATGQNEMNMQEGWSPSRIVGVLVTVAVILFAVIAAANMLGFTIISTMVSSFLVLFGNILLGLAIFALGLWLANMAGQAIQNSGASQANLLAMAARAAIIIFTGALALRQMGLGQDIVNLAFGLLFGAVAVAVALAFGLGGRDVAARELEHLRQNIESGKLNASIPATGGSSSSRGHSMQSGTIPSTGGGSGSSGSSMGGSSSQSNRTGMGTGSTVQETDSSSMDYEGGANQRNMTDDIPPTTGGHESDRSGLTDAGSIPATGGEFDNESGGVIHNNDVYDPGTGPDLQDEEDPGLDRDGGNI
jgi:hypothetical protein